VKIVVFGFCAVLLTGCGAMQTKRVHRTSTAELKLRRQQLIEQIGQPMGWRMTGFRPGTESHESEINEKNRIEMELLHRCQSGDKAACLPQFSR